jgi:hypothetical protein
LIADLWESLIDAEDFIETGMSLVRGSWIRRSLMWGWSG